ncbi:hypothetical protein BH11CYA1_BH11CYA1_12740 [soil metagenome]
MQPTITRVDEADIEAALQVFLTSLADVRQRHGAPPMQQDVEDCRNAYQHISKTGIFYVAKWHDYVVGTANGIIRDGIWFLTGFWVLPDFQGKGIGKKLLTETLAAAKEAGASRFFVWASVDPPAIGNYMHNGMLPGYQIFSYQLSAVAPVVVGSEYSIVALDASAAGDIDGKIWGARREVDHNYWLADDKRVGRLVMHNNKAVAYFYARKGRVGPVGYLEQAHEQATLDLAIQSASEQAEMVTLAIPGINRSATKYIISLNGRLASSSHFLTSETFGQLELYIPSGPLLY